MKFIYIVLFFNLFIKNSVSQYVTQDSKRDSKTFFDKPSIGDDVFEKWPMLSSPKISSDGEFALYTINNQPVGSNTLVIKSINGNWKKEIFGITSNNARFTSNNRSLIILGQSDTLWIYELGTNRYKYILNVISFKVTHTIKGELLAYLLRVPAKKLVLRDLLTLREKYFTAINSYFFANNQNYLWLLSDNDNDSSRAISYVHLNNKNETVVWKGKEIIDYVWDNQGGQLAFLIGSAVGNRTAKELWYYRFGMIAPVVLINKQLSELHPGFVLSNYYFRFSKDGSRIFLSLQKQEIKKILPEKDLVDIWSYTDMKLQSQQKLENSQNLRNNFLSVINVKDVNRNSDSVNVNMPKIIRLEYENENILPDCLDNYNIDHLLVRLQKGSDLESNWNPASLTSVYIISTEDGSRKLLKDKLSNGVEYYFKLSPLGKWIVYYSMEDSSYYSYETATGLPRNITRGMVTLWTKKDYDRPSASPPFGIAGWMQQDEKVFLYDNCDIWKVDPSGTTPSENLTNWYGNNNGIVFHLIDYEEILNAGPKNKESNLLLAAFNTVTKSNGFFKINLNSRSNPELLTMQPFLCYWPFISGMKPLKAQGTNVWIVEYMNSNNAPNYYSTKDFRSFKPLSNIQPQKKYNWLTAELHEWKTYSGLGSQGVLYKPENFDSKKKYPIIFYFYEKLSDRLHEFIKPEASDGPLNISYFVSNGYLVFTPDIYYTKGEPGESAYNFIISAAKYLSKFSWVDSTKMGIQGHSFGGYEVNYLVTHSNIFSAAVSAAGLSDFVSGYNSLTGRGISNQFQYEIAQLRIGFTLWERPDLYVKNSPIFNAQNVTTPLLMMNNNKDGTVPVQQGIEFFTALRRLNKKVWLLQYNNGGHQISGKEAIDYTARLKEFFDHYLKNYPEPKWMK